MEEYIKAIEMALMNDGLINNELIFKLEIDTVLGKWSTINRWLFNRIINESIAVKELFDKEHIRAVNDIFDLQWNAGDIKTHTSQLKLLLYQRQFYTFMEDKPIGIALYQLIPDTNFMYFYRTFVKEEYRGIGAYSHLLYHRVQEARRENKRIVTLSNVETSYPMLLKKGFKDFFTVEMLKYEFSVAV